MSIPDSPRKATLPEPDRPEWTGNAEVAALIEAAHDFGARGWTPATSGNYSLRLNRDTLLMTRSGVDKRRLDSRGLMAMTSDGKPLTEAVPSAEAALHVQIYRSLPKARAVLHVHSPAATVASRRSAARREIVLQNYELLKAFEGVETHSVQLSIPVVANHQDMEPLARSVAPFLGRPGYCPGYLIEGHGIYAWGASVADAARHLDAFDFLLNCELLETRSP
ncbi:MAG: methylthioribulose 1-phosphate dehydratase [Wenzhouxiangellaceae bacterium]